MIDCMERILQENHYKTATGNLELKDSGSNQKVTITRLPNKALMLDMPTKGAHLGIVKDSQELKKICDKVILVQRNNAIDAYFIEMKKTLNLNHNDIPEKACTQILCTIPIWDYLASIARTHFEKKQNINKYFVVIAENLNPRIAKQTMKSKPERECEYKNHSFKIFHSFSTISLQDLR